ncbi:beta-glucosidase [Mycobacterium sp. CBMA247]|nr:beta-glucosidase [Mycolicibacterium sp. CBMA 329]MUL86233.1 beta-glucosidase [Mycolicibacterium sp. CBMA 331]MUM01105.1 beta-glucosidase [Mycolicibacterium sp. CBMA 334]MUM24998.1 beta-glucosidase [Mycolicibacterium sp. CBMA 295]MUM36529.1 beta-glucosidase [Mycolicibacterium sp. CBMA 247]MUM42297.1 beta-glucosidase [Mycolicibacterium sp. CBMA 294]
MAHPALPLAGVSDSTDDSPDPIAGLDLTEQAALGSGASFWTTKAIGTVPALVLTDGPHGVRRQSGSATDHLGISGSEPATCFPPAVGLSQTWDPELVERIGQALGDESRALGVHVLLGPGINIKRDPRCGRNFEYYSEDPLLSGALGAAWVRGVQSRGVGASLKHFAVNNAEHDRMRASSDVDVRTLREIYLRAFEVVVRQAGPWTVMCSYNRINGVYAAENTWLLTAVLRDEWGFDGVVVSDWGAVADRPTAVAAGLDLEMPTTGGISDTELGSAVRAGRLDAAAVTQAAARVARLAARVTETGSTATSFDIDAHHELAREAARRAIVLLKNDDELLPLAPSPLAVIGGFAVEPRYQGGGSSHVNPTRLDIPLDEIRRLTGDHPVSYCPGTDTGAAVTAAASADAAIVFLGLTAEEESEGYDREHIDLSAAQIDLLRAVVEVQPRTVAVLVHGGVVRLDTVAGLAPAVVDGSLLGQAGGGALADVLFGAVNPSGRLAETVPLRLQDSPAYLNFPSESGHTVYGERMFVGYRWYDARDVPVTFPFGHGLSYTRFDYSGLELTATGEGVSVRLTVTNTGARSGREVVQAYAGLPGSHIGRPVRWLAGFAAVTVEPGQRRTVDIPIGRTDLAYWSTDAGRWVVEAGEYVVSVGASSRDLRLTATITLGGDEPTRPFTRDSTLGELLADPVAARTILAVLSSASPFGAAESALGSNLLRMLESVPIGRMAGFSAGKVTREQLDELLAGVNAQRS